MRASTVPNAQLTERDFTDQDVAEFRRLMTEFLTTCKTAAATHAPHGEWEPPASDLFGQFSDSMELIAEVSRALSHTRRDIRTINTQARMRAYDRTSEPAQHRQPH
ncbi:hypothetical protein AB0I77_06195 [Streptomyces sp. NPDC050619]|uniref:hypothetical protein n=1 Tax=Streptomyces sp. NPDC050619 TaxID=3157214 RepID=UPI003432CB6A